MEMEQGCVRRRVGARTRWAGGAMVAMGAVPATGVRGAVAFAAIGTGGLAENVEGSQPGIGRRAVRDRTADVKVLTAPVDGITHE
jgi:hypothetical protein